MAYIVTFNNHIFNYFLLSRVYQRKNQNKYYIFIRKACLIFKINYDQDYGNKRCSSLCEILNKERWVSNTK